MYITVDDIIVLYQMRNSLNLFSVCILYSVPSLQSAFCTEWTKIVLLFFSVTRGRSTDLHQGDSDWGWSRLRQHVLMGRQSEHFESSAGFFAKCHQFTSHHHGANIVQFWTPSPVMQRRGERDPLSRSGIAWQKRGSRTGLGANIANILMTILSPKRRTRKQDQF